MSATRIVLICILTCTAAANGAEGARSASSREIKKGFFGLGVFGGMGGSRFLNSDGSYATYKTNSVGADLDVLLLEPEMGDIRLFIRHQVAKSGGGTPSGESLSQEETVIGLKVYAGSHLYLAGGMGPGKSHLSSPTNSTSVDLKYDVMRASLGLELALTENVFLALEFDYRSAPVLKNKNPDISENTFFEGMGGTLRLIWSPPSVTTINYSK